MKQKTIYLQASGKEEKVYPKEEIILTVSICDDNEEAIQSYDVKSFNKKIVDKKCLEFIELLNINSKKGGTSGALESLKMKGSSLCDELLTPDHKKELRQTNADFLILDIDDHLVHIPWELLYIDDFFLCERFAIGRKVKTRQGIVKSEKRNLSLPLNMWILANPNGDLENAASEGLAIFKKMNKSNGNVHAIKAFLDSDITSEKIKGQIRNYDILHFAGHATFDDKNPGLSGWKLSGDNFNADSIINMAGGKALPAIVFSNACQSARTVEWDIKTIPVNSSFGLANAFMLAGTKHYIGTFGKIPDPTGGKFAQYFYDQLKSSKTIGEALREARLLLQKQQSCIWANYLMYGDPRETYISGIKLDDDVKHFNIEETNIEINSHKNQNTRLRENHQNGNKKAHDDKKTIPQKSNDESTNPKIFNRKKFLFLFVPFLLLITLLAAYLYNSNSKPMTMAVVFDSRQNSIDINKVDTLCHGIMMELKKYSRFRILERNDIDIILQELDIWMSKYVTSKNKKKPNLLQADILLLVKINASDIFMKLFDSQKGDVIDIVNAKLKPGSIIAQSKTISKQLISKLKELYPRCGRISKISNNEIQINIGANLGVKVGQMYRVDQSDIILEVESVEYSFSNIKVKEDNKYLKKGMNVYEIKQL